MKLFVPSIGTKIRLTADWTFTVHPEYRNHSLYEMALKQEVKDFLYNGMSATWKPTPFTMPSGVILTVDRIYIKKGSPDYDSITFRIHKKDDNPPHFAGLRFWVKLKDANNIEGDIL